MLKFSHYTQVHKLKSLTTLINNNNPHACNQQIKIFTHGFGEMTPHLFHLAKSKKIIFIIMMNNI